MKKRLFDLQLFEDGGGSGSEGNQGNNAGDEGNKGTYSFEQAEEIANARAHLVDQPALKSYFKQ